jgi:hypothetical protein
MADWRREVRRVTADCGVEVVNLYSGHGTYTTLGLGHPDDRVRERMKERWIKPMVEAAAELGAGIGFFCHAFPHAVLQDRSQYGEARERLLETLGEIACFGAQAGVRNLGVEQMYSPHQVPWTVAGARDLLRAVRARGGAPFYPTIDTGHAVGQHRFARPAVDELRAAAAAAGSRDLWLGTDAAHRRFERLLREEGEQEGEGERERALREVVGDMDAHPYLFSGPEDGDPYTWLAELGGWSPIVHLQQVTGGSSAHEPFTPEANARGAIHARDVLQAIAASYAGPAEPSLPPRCPSLYLTLEIFAGSGVRPLTLLDQIRASVEYWRRWIPADGLTLAELLAGGDPRDAGSGAPSATVQDSRDRGGPRM